MRKVLICVILVIILLTGFVLAEKVDLDTKIGRKTKISVNLPEDSTDTDSDKITDNEGKVSAGDGFNNQQ